MRTDVIEELVNLITSEPSQDLHESVQYKNPNMACELLTSDVAAICDKLADTEVSHLAILTPSTPSICLMKQRPLFPSPIGS